MMTLAPLPIASAKTDTAGSSERAVTSSVTPLAVSVLAVTRPRPGKCL